VTFWLYCPTKGVDNWNGKISLINYPNPLPAAHSFLSKQNWSGFLAKKQSWKVWLTIGTGTNNLLIYLHTNAKIAGSVDDLMRQKYPYISVIMSVPLTFRMGPSKIFQIYRLKPTES
jgi:hypothetical protein